MKKKGFTLIELIIVLSIISILAVISYPSITEYRKRCKNKDLNTYIEVVSKSLRQYYALEGKYPETVDDLPKLGYGVIIDKKKYQYVYIVEPNLKKYTLNITLR